MLSRFQRSLPLLAALSILFTVTTMAEISPDPNEHVAGQPVILQNDAFDPAAKGVGDPVALDLDDGVAETFIGDNGQFIWFNIFTPDPADFPFQLEEVSAVFGGTGVAIGAAIEVVVYSDTDGDGDPATGTVLLGGCTDVVQFNDGVTFNVYNCPPIVLNGPGDVLIGIINRESFEGDNDFPAALDQTASAERSWAATYNVGDVPANPTLPADEQFGTIDSFGFPGNWIVRGAGTTIAGPENAIPTQGTLGMIILALLLLSAAMMVMWRRRATGTEH